MSKHSTAPATRVTVASIRTMATRGQRIVMTTAYDATFARMLDEGGADILLVGDSLGNVVQGLDTTLPVTLEEMIYHCRAVSRGSKRAHLVGDMPFMSYQISPERALENAGRFLSQGNMHAVKLEGGVEMADTIRRIVTAGIPVMGHVGLTPQSGHAIGGFKVQGKGVEEAERVLQDAKASPKQALSQWCSKHTCAARRTHTARLPSRRSASAPVPVAMAKCWSLTTCSG